MQVYPYQGTVLRGVAPCLDDHKRLVRLDAVNARAKWYAISHTLKAKFNLYGKCGLIV